MSEQDPQQSKLAQVALLAGVSKTTASRALSGTGRVAEQTAQRIRVAAEKLNYRPNPHARALRHNARQPLVAVLMDPDSIFGVKHDTHRFWFVSLYTMWEQLSAHHISVVQLSARSPELLAKLAPDALFYLSLHTDDAPVLDIPATTPTLSSTAALAGIDHITMIGYDYRKACRDAMSLLKRNGSSKIAFVGRPGDLTSVEEAQSEYLHWCSQQRQQPIVLGKTGGNRALTLQLAQALRDGVDGIYSFRGESQSALRAIEQAGLRCPQDVQFVATGEGTAEALQNPLASMIWVDPVRAGATFARALRGLLNGQTKDRITLGHQLVERETTRAHSR